MASDISSKSKLWLATVVLLFIILAKCLLILKNAFLSPLRKVPGPWYAHLTNLVLKFAVIRGQRCQYIHSLHLTYGNTVRVSPNEVAIADLAAFRTIHKVGGTFQKSPWYAKFSDASVPGIFTMTDPRQHAARRRSFAQQFSNTAILKYEQAVRAKVDMAVFKIERDARAANADVFKWWTFIATDVSAQLSFGKSFGMIEQEEKTQYIRDLEKTMMISGMRVELPWLFSLAGLLPVKSIKDALNLTARLDSYGVQAIQNHKDYLAGGAATEQSASLFSKFLDPSKHQSEISEYEVSKEAANLIVAGSDTTAVTLTYLTWAVLRPINRRVHDKLVDEIAMTPSGSPVKVISDLPYLRNVINETLRLYGAAPGSLPRIVPEGGALLGGYDMPAGTTVSTQAYTMHRDGSIFTDPESFKPERWDNPSLAMLDVFSPFGAGSRVCIGLHLAMLELQLGAFEFFKKLPTAQLSPSTTDKSMDFENYFLIAPKEHRCEITLVG